MTDFLITADRDELLKLARAFRHDENQCLHDCANAFMTPQPKAEDHHWQRLVAWDVLISDLKDGIPLDLARVMFAKLAWGERAQ